MKRKQFTETQIIAALKQYEGGIEAHNYLYQTELIKYRKGVGIVEYKGVYVYKKHPVQVEGRISFKVLYFLYDKTIVLNE